MTLSNGDKIRVTTPDGDSESFFVVINGQLVNPENGVTRDPESPETRYLLSTLVVEKVSS